MYLFFFYVLSPFATCTTIVSHPFEACSFSFFMWALKGQKKNCLKVTPGLTLLHFLILECLMKESKFRTSSFSLPLMSKQILHLTILIFSSGPHIGSDQGKPSCPLILKNYVYFPFRFLWPLLFWFTTSRVLHIIYRFKCGCRLKNQQTFTRHCNKRCRW